VFRKSD
jgi:NIMA (never in mitosis gene a)-related kinase